MTGRSSDVDEFPDGLADHPFFVAEERVDLVKVDAAEFLHRNFPLGGRQATVS